MRWQQIVVVVVEDVGHVLKGPRGDFGGKEDNVAT